MNTAPAILKQLQSSAIFGAGLPKRTVVDHVTWAKLSEEEQRNQMMVGVAAIESVRDHRAVADLVRALGKARYQACCPYPRPVVERVCRESPPCGLWARA